MGNKELILEKSLELFFEHWFEWVSMRMIMDVAGVSKWGIYHYFSSKEDILSQSLEHFQAPFVAWVTEILEDNSLSAMEKFKKKMIYVLTMYQKNLDMLVKLHSDKKYLRILDELENIHDKKRCCDIWESMKNLIDQIAEKNVNSTKNIKEKLTLLNFWIHEFKCFVGKNALNVEQARKYTDVLMDIVKNEVV